MVCPQCGATLEGDSNFCASCGMQINETTSSTENQGNRPARLSELSSITDALKGNARNKNIKKIIGLVVGTVIIVIGLARVLTAGTSIYPTSFGGDFYTFTYQGIVAISEMLAVIEVSLGWVIVAIGALIDVITLKD